MIFFLVFALDFGALKLLLSVWILREKLREVNAITLMLRALNSDKSDKKNVDSCLENINTLS